MASKKKLITKFIPAGYRPNFTESLNDETEQEEMIAVKRMLEKNKTRKESLKGNGCSQILLDGLRPNFTEILTDETEQREVVVAEKMPDKNETRKGSVKANAYSQSQCERANNQVTNRSFRQVSSNYSEGGNFEQKPTNNGSIISVPKTICRNKRLPVVDIELHDNSSSRLPVPPTIGEISKENGIEVNGLNRSDENNHTNVESDSFVIKNNPNVNEIKDNNVRKKTRREALESIKRNREKKIREKASSEVNYKIVASKTETSEQRENCKKYIKCTTCTEECDNFINCPEWCLANIKFEGTDGNKRRTFLKFDNKKKIEITRKHSNKIIIHGVMIPRQVSSLYDTYFSDDIKESLKRLNYILPKDIQSYVWPGSLRGMNIFMIGSSKTGKSLAYLPTFCSLATQKYDKYSELSKYEGPLFVILCSNVEGCDKVAALIKSLLPPSSALPKLNVLSNENELQIASNCDILIAMPLLLEKVLISGAGKIQRLTHIAIEDTYVVLKKYSDSMRKLFKVVNELQTNRPYHTNIQIIVSSQKWSSDLEILLKQVNVTPVVCFQDFLEAAVYAKVEFTKKTLSKSHKLYYLNDILKKRYMIHRTVIFCDKKEIMQVNKDLEILGIECMVISNNLPEDEIFENEGTWLSLKRGHYKVLLCTDKLFKKTQHILNAQWLVHHHLPSDWFQFCERFRALAANMMSPLTSLDENEPRLCSVLIMDEDNNKQFSNELLELLTRKSVKHLHLP